MPIIGNPFVGNVPKQMSNDELAQALRVDIADEMEAIISYEAHALATTDANVKKVLYHIADEERNHVGELQQLLYMICPKEAEQTEKGRQSVQQQQMQNFQIPLQ